MRKGLWSPDEDEKLKLCIAQHRSGSWSDIARKAGLQRCGKSCRRRWMNHLRPDLKREKFTADELKLVAKLHQTLGNKWSEIATYLVGRTDNDVKNLWNTQIKKQSKCVYHEEPSKRKCSNLEAFPFSMDSSTDHMGQVSFQNPQLVFGNSSLTNTSLVANSWGSPAISASTFDSHKNLARSQEVMNTLYKPLHVSTSHEGENAQTPLVNEQSRHIERISCSFEQSPLVENVDSCATLMGYIAQNQPNSDVYCGYYDPISRSSTLMENISKYHYLDDYRSSPYDASQEGPRSSNESSTSALIAGDDTCSASKPCLFELHHKVQFDQIDDSGYQAQDQKDNDDTNCLSRGESWSSSSSDQWTFENFIGSCEKDAWFQTSL